MRGVTNIPSSICAGIPFLLTRLMRGVTLRMAFQIQKLYISTHTPHARRDNAIAELLAKTEISTHTPHARRDISKYSTYDSKKISTHTPHARRDSGGK